MPSPDHRNLCTPKCEDAGAKKMRISNDSSMADSTLHVPDDPNLECPECREVFKKGEIQKFRSHVQRYQ